MGPIRVILLPGAVLPAQPAYGALIGALGPDMQALAKDLELYAGDDPPPGWSLDAEIDGVLRKADVRGWETFHLAGYSGGGAAALAVVAKHPQRLLSLALLEPAWAGTWDWSPAHAQLWKAFDRLEILPPGQFMPEFLRLQVKPDVVLPPPAPGSLRRGWQGAWPASRPSCARSGAMVWTAGRWLRSTLPVLFVLGGRSNPDQFGDIAERLSTVFPDFRLEVLEDRHHFDPPHRVEPERLGALLREHWDRAEGRDHAANS